APFARYRIRQRRRWNQIPRVSAIGRRVHFEFTIAGPDWVARGDNIICVERVNHVKERLSRSLVSQRVHVEPACSAVFGFPNATKSYRCANPANKTSLVVNSRNVGKLLRWIVNVDFAGIPGLAAVKS